MRSRWLEKAILLVVPTLAFGATSSDRPLGVTADLTVASKYMTDGFKIGGDNPVVQPGLNVSIAQTGLSVMFWSVLQMNRDNRTYDELDLFLRYGHEFFQKTSYQLSVHGYFDYWFYPTNQTGVDEMGAPVEQPERHGNKLNAGFTLPRLIPVAGSYLVPGYNAYYWVYWAQNRRDLYQGGAHHEGTLSYFHSLPELIPGAKLPYVGATGSVNYQDGAFQVQPGLSHSVGTVSLGASALGGIFGLSLNHQWSYNASVDPTDETWSTLSFTKEL